MRTALILTAAAASVLAAACQRVPLLAPSGSTITLISSTSVLAINGKTTLIAQVLESSGTPPQSGTHVSFTTTMGSVQPSEANTDISGRVVVDFLAGTSSGTATITAFSGGAGGAAASGTTTSTTGGTATTSPANTVRIAIGAAAVSALTVSALPMTVPNVGGTSTVTANVRDTNGNVLPGVPVAFTTDNGSLNPAVVNTDQNGNAQTVLTTSKVAKVTGTAGLAAGTGTTAVAGQSGTVTVNVNVVSTISIGTPSPASPSVGQSVTFPFTYVSDTNSAPIQSVSVDFGDGTAASRLAGKPASASHTYAAVGSFSVRATLTDALGDTSTGSGSVNVVPLAGVTIGAPTPASPIVGQAVSFPLTYSTTGGSPVQRLVVDFGDGTTPVSFVGAPSGINHTYGSIGTFALQLTAFDSFGNTSSATASVSIGPLPAPTIGVPSPASPTARNTVTFPITYATGSTSAIQRIVVNFGDNTASVAFTGAPSSVSHQYESSGTFGVQVTIFDAFGNSALGSTSVFVAARPQPTVAIAINTPNPTADTDVAFTVTITPPTGTVIDDVSVDFGDGTTQNLGGGVSGSIVLHHVYPVVTTGNGSATYNVTVTALDSNGGRGTGFTSVFVQVAPPLQVSISSTQNTVGSTTTVSFTATVTGQGNSTPVSYLWTFGDGSSAPTTNGQVVHPYVANSGAKTVTVLVTISDGRTVTGQTVVNP